MLFVRILRQVLHRRLSIDACEEQAGKQRRGTAFEVPGRRVGSNQGVKALQEGSGTRRHPQALEQQVVQAESDVEGGIAVPRALRVEEYRAIGPGEDVLRADVAVD